MQAHILLFPGLRILVLKAEKCRFFYVLDRFLCCLTLAVAPLKSEIRYRIPAFFFLLQDDGKCAVSHAGSIPYLEARLERRIYCVEVELAACPEPVEGVTPAVASIWSMAERMEL